MNRLKRDRIIAAIQNPDSSLRALPAIIRSEPPEGRAELLRLANYYAVEEARFDEWADEWSTGQTDGHRWHLHVERVGCHSRLYMDGREVDGVAAVRLGVDANGVASMLLRVIPKRMSVSLPGLEDAEFEAVDGAEPVWLRATTSEAE